MATPRKTASKRKKPTKIRRLSAVIRVSRRNDREGDAFMSPDEQRDAITRWAERDDIEIVSWHDETDSVSGKTTDRAGLKAALDEAFSGASDGVICAKLDRFARNVVEGLQAVLALHEAGKAFVAVREGIHGDEHSSTPTGKLTLTILLAIAMWQLETLTESWDASVARHIANGVARNEPFGYKRNAAPPGTPRSEQKKFSRQLEPDKVEAKLVKKMFEMRASTKPDTEHSWLAIADYMNSTGVPSKRGGSWTSMAIQRIVRNRVYLGELRSGEHVNLAAHKPIVDHDLWERAQRASDRTPGRSDRAVYLLAGIVRCAGCGARMVGYVQTKGDKGIRYYRCRRRFSWGACAGPVTVNADQLEDFVTKQFEERLLSRTWHIEAEKMITAEREEALETLRDAQAHRDFLLSSPAIKETRRRFGDEAFEVTLMEATEAVVAAEQRLAEVTGRMLGFDLPAGMEQKWHQMGSDQRRHYLAGVFPVIAVRAGQRWREPVPERTKVWIANTPGIPTDLPGRGGTDTKGLRPIAW